MSRKFEFVIIYWRKIQISFAILARNSNFEQNMDEKHWRFHYYPRSCYYYYCYFFEKLVRHYYSYFWISK